MFGNQSSFWESTRLCFSQKKGCSEIKVVKKKKYLEESELVDL